MQGRGSDRTAITKIQRQVLGRCAGHRSKKDQYRDEDNTSHLLDAGCAKIVHIDQPNAKLALLLTGLRDLEYP
ncbi:hypothetical protein GCM10011363_37630 [Marivita lacus]|uniref:Uncharacterized protein n=1 Tax=Marivita lacus TaxID=1323742 RepID=A0ABQ1L6B7_9RHOB|nr:hypothetical protein GCM10011363_37630 [Marivita lacus]